MLDDIVNDMRMWCLDNKKNEGGGGSGSGTEAWENLVLRGGG